VGELQSTLALVFIRPEALEAVASTEAKEVGPGEDTADMLAATY
jgi:hypothetical protein